MADPWLGLRPVFLISPWGDPWNKLRDAVGAIMEGGMAPFLFLGPDRFSSWLASTKKVLSCHRAQFPNKG